MRNLFEKYFKTKLVDRQPSVSHDDWLSIQQKLHGTKQKRRGAIWWTFPLLLLFTGAGLWILTQKPVENSASTQPTLNEQKSTTIPSESKNTKIYSQTPSQKQYKLYNIPKQKMVKYDKFNNQKEELKDTAKKTISITSAKIITQAETYIDKTGSPNAIINKEPEPKPENKKADSINKPMIPAPHKKQYWTFGVSAAPLFANTKSIGADVGYERLKDHTTKLGFGTTLIASYTTNNIQINSAIGYSRYNTEGLYRITYPTYDSFPVLDTGGHVIGYLYQNYRDSIYNKTIAQHINRLSIPVSIAYIFSNNKQWSFPVRVGLQMDIGKQKSTISLTPFLLSGTVQAGVRYKLDEYLYICLEPKYSFGLNNIYTNKLNERLNSISFALSALYKF